MPVCLIALETPYHLTATRILCSEGAKDLDVFPLCICLGPQHCNGPLKSMWVYEQTCLYTLEFSYLVRSFQVTEWRGMFTSVCPALGTVPEWNTVCWMNTWSQGRARIAGGRMIRNRECGWKDSLWSASIHCMYTFLRSTPTESRTFSLLLFIIPHSVSF